MVDLREQDLAQMQGIMLQIGEQKFRAKQVFEWIYKGKTEINEMSNLPFSLRQKLIKFCTISRLSVECLQSSKRDPTRKYLFATEDKNLIESVYMQYEYGNSICISSQVGCKMGCVFCASAKCGFIRNLTAGEMVSQIIDMHIDMENDEKLTNSNNGNHKINHIVVMGIGEPFDNYDNLAKFIKLVNSKDGLNLGMRNITVSTCGLVPQILQFAIDFPQVNLAISLHSSVDEVRSSIMPINEKYNITELIDTCRKYIDTTNRRITFEYALIQGENDSNGEAERLANLLKGLKAHVNLIPLNSVSEIKLNCSSRQSALKFQNNLESRGIPTTIRRKLGADIDAACGQLRINNYT